MWFQVLGPVRARRAGNELPLGTPQQRTTLAAIIAAEGEPVSVSALLEVLWSGWPPPSAAATVHQYVRRLRRVIEPEHGGWDPAALLRRTAGGYRLAADDSQVDLLRWRGLVGAARRAVARADPAAADAYAEALDLWSGPVVCDLPAEARAHPVFAALDREYVAVLSEAADLALAAGRTGVLVPTLIRATGWHPYDEGLQARLLRALAAAGRRAEALDRFRELRARFAEELGTEPGPEVRDAHEAALAGPQPGAGPAGHQGGARPAVPFVPPAQLPADLPTFSGRGAELDRLDELGGAGAAPLVVVTGLGGVGKTSLALRWAHRVRDAFPDGQLYVDLLGFAPANAPMAPAEALHCFLEALGLSRANQPSAPDNLTALYRSVLAGKRVLIVLDNARDEHQVRPLLPGTAGCAVLVTSRACLDGLVVGEGAHPVRLGVFDRDDAHRYLRSRAGADRIDGEPDAAREIIEVCGGLPLALAICAAWAGRGPAFTLGAVAEEIRRRDGLDAFAGVAGGRDVRAVFSWSYGQLSPAAAELFRRLGRHPGPDLAPATAASVGGRPRAETLTLLAELVNAQLLTEQRPGRYGAHDLVRAYAAEFGDEEERRRTLRRAIEHYLHSLIAGAKLLSPQRATVDTEPPSAGVTPFQPADASQALSWFADEQANVWAALDAAEQERWDPYLWLFSWALNAYFMTLGWWDEAESVARRALAAAERQQESWWSGYLIQALGIFKHEVGDYDEALRSFERAAAVGHESGDRVRTATGLIGMAAVLLDRHGWTAGEYVEQAAALAEEARVLSEEVVRSVPGGWAEPRTARAWVTIADYCEFSAVRILVRTGDVPAAVAEVRRGIEIDRQFGGGRESWMTTVEGQIYEYAGDYAGAVQAYERALAMTSRWRWEDSVKTLIALASAYARLGDDEAAADARGRARDRLDGVYHGRADELRARLAKTETVAR